MLKDIIAHQGIPVRYATLIKAKSPILADVCTYISNIRTFPQRFTNGFEVLQLILDRAKACFYSPKANYQNPIRR
jgi:hypothetical protein